MNRPPSTETATAISDDLNLINLPHLVKIGGVNEVSIGHAIVVDALNYGFEDTIKRYIEVIKG